MLRLHSLTRSTSVIGITGVPVAISRRDIVLLPLIFLGTMAILLAAGEITARVLYPQVDAPEPCEFQTMVGSRFHTGCTSHSKMWEGEWVTQHFNDCGYRTEESCAPRPADALRVAVVGSSTARGMYVNYADSFAAQVSAALSKRCGRLVDFQNLGTEPTDVGRIDQRMPEVLALKPTAIVMVIGPFDMAHVMDLPPMVQAPVMLNRGWLVEHLLESRLLLVLKYYVYRDPAFQVRAFLRKGEQADIVRMPLNAVWSRRAAKTGDLLARIGTAASKEHVPVLIFYIPPPGQVAMAKMAGGPPGVDPFLLQTELAQKAADLGMAFYDATRAFAEASNLEHLFFLTDGHSREGGHTVLAGIVEQALLAEQPFAGCNTNLRSH